MLEFKAGRLSTARKDPLAKVDISVADKDMYPITKYQNARYFVNQAIIQYYFIYVSYPDSIRLHLDGSEVGLS